MESLGSPLTERNPLFWLVMQKKCNYVEKPWVSHGEMESLGKSQGKNPRLFHRLSHFARSIEGLMMMRPYWLPRIKLPERDSPSTVPASVKRPTRRVCSIVKWTNSPDCFLTISSVWASDRDYICRVILQEVTRRRGEGASHRKAAGLVKHHQLLGEVDHFNRLAQNGRLVPA